MLTTLTTA